MYLCITEVSLAFRIIPKKSEWHDVTIPFQSPTLINIHLFLEQVIQQCCQHFKGLTTLKRVLMMKLNVFILAKEYMYCSFYVIILAFSEFIVFAGLHIKTLYS